MPTPISLRPGRPDDDNRDYLPESLKASDIVVNENGNNSQPYPERLTEHHGVIADDLTDEWYLYVPEHVTSPAPLVIAMHGGLMTGWGQAVYTSWTLVAEREGFIVLFPNASQRRIWTIDIPIEELASATKPNPEGIFLNRPAEHPADNHDVKLVLGLIEWVAERHAIDRGRIFMQGMSMGNAMTSYFTRHLGHVLAGAAGSAGPTAPQLLRTADGEVINAGGPVAVWQTRADLDDVPPHYPMGVRDVVVANRDYWREVNGALGTPAIAIRGEDNFAFYRGEAADVVFRDVHNRDHGQTFDDAELVWSHLFSGTRRLPDGRIEHTEPDLPRTGDAFAVAVADSRSKAWLNGSVVDLPLATFTRDRVKYHGQGGGTLLRAQYLFVPVRFLAQAFGAECEQSEDATTATVRLPDGRVCDFARGSIGCLIDQRVHSMLLEAVTRDGELCLSLEWFAAHLFDLHTTSRDGVLYVTDHHARLSSNMARLIDDLLR